MQPREKLLAAVIVALLALGGGYWVASGVYTHFADLKLRRDQLTGELQQIDLQLQRGLRLAEKQRQWRQQSLPTDLTRASSHYLYWLLELTSRPGVEFNDTNVSSSRSTSRLGIYRKLPFTIRGEGDLRQLTNFLYHFYEGNHLHKIARMTVKPLQGTDKLDLTITIEALSLPDADRTNQLAEGNSGRLADRTLDDYTETIVERDLFARYRPEPPRARDQRPDPEVDPTRFAFVSGWIDDGAPQVWINLRTEGKVLKLGEGEDFRVGQQRYKILRIRSRSVELESDGRRISVAFGHNLQEAVDLPSATASIEGSRQ